MEEFRVNGSALNAAAGDFAGVKSEFEATTEALKTALKNIGEQTWPSGGPAKNAYDAKMDEIKGKLDKIGAKFEYNKLIFNNVLARVAEFEGTMAGHIGNM